MNEDEDDRETFEKDALCNDDEGGDWAADEADALIDEEQADVREQCGSCASLLFTGFGGYAHTCGTSSMQVVITYGEES